MSLCWRGRVCQTGVGAEERWVWQVCYSVFTEHLLGRHWIPSDEEDLIAALKELTPGLTGDHSEADVVYFFCNQKCVDRHLCEGTIQNSAWRFSDQLAANLPSFQWCRVRGAPR